MAKLRLDSGTEYDVLTVAKSFDGTCVIILRDDRRLSAIADEFDGAQYLLYIDDDGKETKYNGYSELISIARLKEINFVQISMGKPEEVG